MWGSMSASERTSGSKSLRALIEHGRSAARIDAKGRLARATLRHAMVTTLPDRLLGGALSRRHLRAPVHLRERELWVPGWPVAFDGIRIAHVSDLHVGELMPVDRALQVIDLVRQGKPDLVACTGDIVDLHVAGCEPVFDALGSIPAELGSYFVLGNHDLLDSARRVLRLSRGAGLVTLRSSALTTPQGLRIAGVDWANSIGKSATLVRRAVVGSEAPHLLLAHNPKAFREAARLGVPLTLAGHTHGGQVALRERSGSPRAVRRGVRLKVGHYHDGASHLFVTSGAGGWFPLRVNCPAEVVNLIVRSAPVK